MYGYNLPEGVTENDLEFEEEEEETTSDFDTIEEFLDFHE